MKKLLLLMISMGSISLMQGQRVSFVYLEGAKDQPFFVKMAERTVSSGPAGFVILPKLADSTYSIRIGFPQNKWPEQVFRIAIQGGDLGYQLRNFEEKGWGLFNLQTLEVLMAAPGVSTFRAEPRNVTPFTAILAKASNDPSLLFNMIRISAPEPVVETTAVVKETAPPPVPESQTIKDPPVAVIDTPQTPQTSQTAQAAQTPQTAQAVDTAQAAQAIKPPVIENAPPVSSSSDPVQPAVSRVIKRGESSTTLGLGLLFLDEYDGHRDTIRILIPEPVAVPVVSPVSSSPVPGLKPARDADSNKAVLPVNCKTVTTDAEFIKLRKRMTGAPDEQAMLDAAGKATRSKCLLTEQLRELGSLFLGDGGRYKLFSLAYPKVADPANFASLGRGITDPYFLGLFRELAR